MAMKENHISIRVDKDFFEQVFEPSREKIQKKLGVRISQPKFTRMLFKNNIDLTPKLNFDMKMDLKLRSLNIRNVGKKIGIKKQNKRKK